MGFSTSCAKGLTQSQIHFFHENGYLHLTNELSDDICRSLRQRAMHHVERYAQNASTFPTNQSTQDSADRAFLDSSDKVHCFYEKDALNFAGELLVPPQNAVSKIGHNLHNLDPLFQRISYSDRVQSILKSLDYRRPVAIQSMFIFKQPRIGGEVPPHQDGSFLATDPQSVIGIWWALQDCTVDNGCLWGIPGSHRSFPIQRRFRRTTPSEIKRTGKLVTFDSQESLSVKCHVPILAEAGDAVLLHNAFVHSSEQNKSEHSRHAFTLHVVESKNTIYKAGNWLQPINGIESLEPMYSS
uniref:PhytanoylCoA dioxygenase domaincontaining protein pu n=1 Tax=Albugo laibachii Nc14 TaxID=890382 RepID=F0WKP0_9STRA|nr:phytanoylCoA dioxygenase domaincontaining protein pu [Albugo laibachii Nc14]|eukprot:CCA21847.1 phytanoylCoA dioxygenase domaincontaining protein pu [Albugo laibachii Nc14]